MTMTEVRIRVPSEVAAYLQTENQRSELERNALLLYPAVNSHAISHGRAAEMLGIRKYDLIELYDQLGLSYLSQSMDEIDEELSAWHKLKGVAE